MLVDPTQTAVYRYTLRVKRGSGFLTGQGIGTRTDIRLQGSEDQGLDDRGLRLSLTLPCTSVRGVVV